MGLATLMDEGGYRGGGTTGGKCGCALAAFVGLPVMAFLMFTSFYGDCGPGERCHDDEGWRFIGIVFVVAAVAGAVGLVTRHLVNRPRDDDVK